MVKEIYQTRYTKYHLWRTGRPPDLEVIDVRQWVRDGRLHLGSFLGPDDPSPFEGTILFIMKRTTTSVMDIG